MRPSDELRLAKDLLNVPDLSSVGLRVIRHDDDWRRFRSGLLETDVKLAAYVADRLAEGWTPEQIAGRLRLGIERGLRAVCAETIYGWIYRTGQKTERLWRFLTRHHARRTKRNGRASKDRIAEKIHISQRSEDADAREVAGHWPFGDAGIACRLAGSRPRDLQALASGVGAS